MLLVVLGPFIAISIIIMEFKDALKELEEEAGIKFKEEQVEIMESTVKQKDTLMILPTGFGKSVCFGFHHQILDKVSMQWHQ